MSEYRAFYKCRLCGEIYDSGICGGEKISTGVVAEFCCDCEIARNKGIPVSMRDMHKTDNHIGLSDFVGFKKTGEKAERKEKINDR